ncbi:hypothetical protein QBC45DRAFT_392083 [Copromyces sp. CBS 386.78]|nr:hypothetical protein QBC45DRAFT_392083 [Copromyces sp. CBS 386.78]
MNQAGGQVPMNHVGGQIPMNPPVGQPPMSGGLALYPTENIVQMDIVMADVAGTDLHMPLWKILDSIFYFVRDDRWASIPNVHGNFRSKSFRPSVPSNRRSAAALMYVPATWNAYLGVAKLSAPGHEEMRQLVQTHMAFAVGALNWAVHGCGEIWCSGG